jgi:hypothetical protein
MRRTPRPGRSAPDARRGDRRRLWRPVAPRARSGQRSRPALLIEFQLKPEPPSRSLGGLRGRSVSRRAPTWSGRLVLGPTRPRFAAPTATGLSAARTSRPSRRVAASARLDHRGEHPCAVRPCQRVPDGPTDPAAGGGARCGGSSAPHARMPTSAAGQCLPPGRLTGAQRERLERLLRVTAGHRVTELEWLRMAPVEPTIEGLIAALERLRQLPVLADGLAGLEAAAPRPPARSDGRGRTSARRRAG